MRRFFQKMICLSNSIYVSFISQFSINLMTPNDKVLATTMCPLSNAGLGCILILMTTAAVTLTITNLTEHFIRASSLYALSHLMLTKPLTGNSHLPLHLLTVCGGTDLSLSSSISVSIIIPRFLFRT